MITRNQAEEELQNWGRWCYSDMEQSGVAISGHTVPPTSAGYQSPPYVEGETPEAVMPVDELLGELTNDIVVQIGLTHFDSYRVLSFWYRSISSPGNWPRTVRRRMAELMECTEKRAQMMLEDAITRYQNRRLQTTRKCG